MSRTLSPGRTIMARLEAIRSKDQVAPEHHGIFDAVVKSRGAVQGPFTMLMHCPPLAEHFVSIGGYIRFEGKLDHRVRVLAAMTVAREFDALYIWGAQTGQARRQGVPESTITAIREKHSRGVPPEDAQIIDFTRELIRKHRVDDATMKALRDRFGDYQLVELTGTIGYYSMLAMTANACELEPAKGAEVLEV
jgi:4-carboxymuconolactone decarboxylase